MKVFSLWLYSMPWRPVSVPHRWMYPWVMGLWRCRWLWRLVWRTKLQ